MDRRHARQRRLVAFVPPRPQRRRVSVIAAHRDEDVPGGIKGQRHERSHVPLRVRHPRQLRARNVHRITRLPLAAPNERAGLGAVLTSREGVPIGVLRDRSDVVVVTREEPLPMRRPVVHHAERGDVVDDLTARRDLQGVARGRAREAVDEIQRERSRRLGSRPPRDLLGRREPLRGGVDAASALRVRHLPEEIRVFSVDERPLLNCLHARRATRAHGERPGEHVARHEPVRVDANLGEDRGYLLVAEVLDPERCPRGAELRAIALTGMRGTPRVGDERCGDDVNLPSVLLASLRDSVPHLFQGVLASPSGIGVDGLMHGPCCGPRRSLGLEPTARLTVQVAVPHRRPVLVFSVVGEALRVGGEGCRGQPHWGAETGNRTG